MTSAGSRYRFASHVARRAETAAHADATRIAAESRFVTVGVSLLLDGMRGEVLDAVPLLSQSGLRQEPKSVKSR